MPEPLSIFNAVISALVWTNRAKEFVESIIDAPETVKRIADDLDAIKQPLEDVSILIQNAPTLDPSAKSQLAQGLSPALQSCEQIAKDIEDALRPYVKPDRNPRRNVWRRMAFSYKADKTTKLQEELMRCKSSLIVAIAVTNMLIQVKQVEQGHRIDQETQRTGRGIQRLQRHFQIETSSIADSESIADEGGAVRRNDIQQWLSRTQTVVEEEEAEPDDERSNVAVRKSRSGPHDQIPDLMAQTEDTRLQSESLTMVRKLSSGPRVLDGHMGLISSVAFPPNGNTIVSGSFNRTLELWDLTTRAQLWKQPSDSAVLCVAFSPDGSTIVSGSGKTISLWDVTTGRQLWKHSHHLAVACVAFSPKGSAIVSGSWDTTVSFWDAATGRQIRELHCHTGDVSRIAFSPNHSIVAIGSDGGTIRLWNMITGREGRQLRGHTDLVGSLAFSPDSSTIASGSWDQTIRLWDVASGRQLWERQGHRSGINSIAYSPNGDKIVSGSSDHMIKVWSTVTGTQVRGFRGHKDTVSCAVFSPDGSMIASGGENIMIWNTAT